MVFLCESRNGCRYHRRWDASNHFLTYGVEGMLIDLMTYAAGEDPRIQPRLKGSDGLVEDCKIKRELLENRYS